MILASLVALFVFIGAHVPKAFTLFYLALAIGTFWTYRQAPSMGLRRSQLIPPIWVLICLQVFSLGHAYGMVHYGYWGYAYRDFADLLSSVFLPIWCISLGFALQKVNKKLLTMLIVAYSAGALFYFLLALLKTRGFNWYSQVGDVGSILTPWGSEQSMNIRSMEQNGILALVGLPLGFQLLLRGRQLAGWFLVLFGVVAGSATIALGGRLWIPSFFLASLPLVFGLVAVFKAKFLFDWRSRAICLGGFVTFLIALSSHFSSLCDERFSLYVGFLRRLDQVFWGGRSMRFDANTCDGGLYPYDASGIAATSPMAHNVILDLIKDTGVLAVIPLLIIFVIIMFKYFMVFLPSVVTGRVGENWSDLALNGATAVLIVQFMFQPVLYGDGLLYYFAYIIMGALLAWTGPNEKALSASPALP